MNEPSMAAWLGAHLAGRYRLDRLLGQGGMGAVFEAFDTSLQRTIAVKVVLPDRSTHPESVARFLREARSAAALSHPGIVAVHDVGQAPTPSGTTPYLVMERLRGESLSDRLLRGPLGVEEARTLANGLLEALAVAHEAGVVHRDLKPDNIFLRAPNASPTIVDFGIATMIESASTGPHLTKEGQSLGTPVYMAPEQITGERVGPRTDLYAVGALLYEAVTGATVYRAETFPALVFAKTTTDPDPALLLSSIGDGPFARTVLAALARDPALRPQDARAMASALSRPSAVSRPSAPSAPSTIDALASTASHDSLPSIGAPSVSARTTTSERIAPASRTRVVVVAVVTILACAALVGGGAIAIRAASSGATTPRPRDVAFSSAGGRTTTPPEPAVALRVLNDFRSASGSRRSLLESAEVWEQCAEDFQLAVDRGATTIRWRAGLELCRGYAKLLRGDSAEALPILSQAVALEPNWPEARVPHAEALFAVGRIEESIAALRTALRLDSAWWVPNAKLGSIYARRGDYAEAIQAYRRARDAAPLESRVVDSLALTYHAAEMDELANETAAQAIALDPEAPWSHLIVAERALEDSRGADALSAADRTLATYPSSAAAMLARADALAMLHRDDAARRAYAQVLELVGDTTDGATGLPSDRLALVRDALANERLPAPRGSSAAERSSARSTARSRPRSAPSGRSSPRSSPFDALDGL